MKTALGAHSGLPGPHTRCVPGDFPFPSRVAVPYVNLLWNWRFLPKQGSAMHIRRLVIPEYTGKCLKLKIQTDWGQQPIFLIFQSIDLFLAMLGLRRCKRGRLSSCGSRPSHCDSFSCCDFWTLSLEGWGGEGSGRRVQDEGAMYTYDQFILMYGKIHHNIVK